MKKKKSVFKRIANVLLTVFVILLAAVIALTMFVRITGNTPSLFGYSIFRVTTGSMQPELMVGDVILTKEVDDVNSLQVGDVITYRGTIGDYANMMITHKIVKAPYQENGKTYVVTKGVANNVEDQPVEASQISAKLVCKIPFLDWIYSFFLTPWGLISAIFIIIIAFSGEFWSIYKLSRSEKDDLPEVNQEILEKAIEQYKKEKPTNENDYDALSDDIRSETQDNENK